MSVGWAILIAWLAAGIAWYAFLYLRGYFAPTSREKARQFAWAICGGLLLWLGWAIGLLVTRRW